MTRVIVDTGPLVALLDRSDQWHRPCLEAMSRVAPPLVTCEPVLAEALYLLRRHPRALDQIEEWMRDSLIEVCFSFPKHRARIFSLMRQYANLPMSLADACVVVMSECGLADAVFTVDRHFEVYRRNGNQAIPIILPSR